MALSVVILAAGQGKRMKSDLPKVLQPLAGRPLLAHVIDTAAALDAAGIQVVYGHGGELVRQTLSEAPVSWVLQAEQLGTGHAVMQALPAIPDDHIVLVLYGDVPLVRAETLERLLARVQPQSLALLSVNLADPAGYGRIVRNGAGAVVRIVEDRDAGPGQKAIREVNTGLMALPAVRLRRWLEALGNDNAQREYYLTDVVGMAVAEGVRVEALPVESETEVLGVNDRIQLAEVEAALRRERARALMRAGATVVDPARLDVRGEVEIGRDVLLDVNVVLEGRVRLGDRARIGPNCVIRDCDIGEDTVVLPNCVLEQTSIGAGCSIGPFARLRPEARLDRGVHIGNFVEVKKSSIGAGSKANHLSYIGDATIGERVNVGAGTITCNYDGANKWSTEIDSGAFIGSGTMLVAPVRIGENATIGAGSTITRDAPPEALTLERSKQVTVEGWKRPKKK